MNKPCYNDFFSTFLSPGGQVLFFSYSFKFYGGTFRLCCVITTKRLLSQSGRTPPRVKNLYKVHKADGPHQGLKTYTKVHKEDGPHQGLKTYTKVQKVDGPNTGRIYITPKKRTDSTNVQYPNPHNGRTQPVHKIILVHKVDGHQGSRLNPTKWTDPTRVANVMSPQHGRIKLSKH